MPGVPELRQAVARTNKRFHDLDIDWPREVTVNGTDLVLAGTRRPG